MEVDGAPPAGPPVPAASTGMDSKQLQPQGAPAATVRRRAPIACRRCRRMRSKCLHERAQPPCRACLDAGLDPSECVFPIRGQPDQDREYRHPRVRAGKSRKRDVAKVHRDTLDTLTSPLPSLPATPGQAKGADVWDLLPPLPEVIEAVNRFTRHYFQLGFIPKDQFLERLRTQHRSVSVFFLLGILSISARLTPALVRRYGSAVGASETFMARSSALAQNEVYQEPSLERCQAFYLLSVAQQGSGMKHRSSINMAIAMRMATLMQLHREETYMLPNPTSDLIIRAESARRTLWMLHSQDNLHSGPRAPVLLSASDITALLPCNESEYLNAREPKSRAALQDTPPALERPALVADEERSLFAALIQAHHYWGVISRRAINKNKSSRPWEPDSEYAQMEKRLARWEAGLPNDYRWSSLLFKAYQQEGQDLAYLGVAMTVRLCNIVIRKAYLHEMISDDKSNADRTAFWLDMARQLFWNVNLLYEQIEAHYTDKPPDDGPGTQMTVFCVYSCGFLACYLCKFPHMCPNPAITRNAPIMVQRILNILAESRSIWPLASRWYDHLQRFFMSQNVIAAGAEGSMADSREPIPHVLDSTPGQPPVKPMQPRFGSTGNEQNTMMAQEPNMSIPNLPQPLTGPSGYSDTNNNLTLPISQSPAPPGLDGQASSQTTGPRQATDGLGLLIEAFDTHRSADPPAAPETTGAPPPGSAYTIFTAPQQHYSHPVLAMNDGYEHELGYYMSDGEPPVLQQGWVGSGDMGGY
ncbi:uncharacterized protein B0T15DRAFT_548868 [Chaetomium strumarium]|uniref:Zn(2)-C6 fungal-type domain-containing protein n=1 Tax=Chaetomium strumarium TaxID=1170767 RepID=A0AAJ0H414_9PEZI|nr:hypothetical protein B0T15DRAFT_548868 [Chaetomium strumarium]